MASEPVLRSQGVVKAIRSGGALAMLPRIRMEDLRSIHETLVQDAGALDTVNARIHAWKDQRADWIPSLPAS